jgi:phage tail-like protein
MTVQGAPINYEQGWNFGVEVDGITTSKWTSAGPLEFEVGEIRQAENGVLADQKRPGKVAFPDCTLTKGASSDMQMYQWALQSADAFANAGAVADDLLKTLSIVQYDRDKTEMKRWNLFEAFVKKAKVGEWNADAEENTMEEWVICYRYFTIG